ncbi:hypothetical protein BS78_K059100 [Paspalum vaginatum]|uniref:Uncharacterized protein n=1 Tax=Paspalum vaginatum TaxID=158149 RepID=A0A9W8CE63_9POAL|nr:hypothetical protein BS78_K059100 [Paspalum vaginatum]
MVWSRCSCIRSRRSRAKPPLSSGPRCSASSGRWHSLLCSCCPTRCKLGPFSWSGKGRQKAIPWTQLSPMKCTPRGLLAVLKPSRDCGDA